MMLFTKVLGRDTHGKHVERSLDFAKFSFYYIQMGIKITIFTSF